ncbi:FMN-binding negative transcriptional regulator [Microbacterium horticulturae]|uniref:FMN-binding negative transcriptional regulator n=1 Tax=Microbacterium horticulturae TaxID=3028316 RepID=A0ABY8C0D2_9MICO|nr:FMN-binding negative transcriptional regulator [Microbacterium sp. KACC 23027]WEG08685.1 FMN-binding negative transcriptional regulator [Microbacterium sp. KACC 23027]
MRPNPDYALEDVERIRDLVRENPWATMITSVPGRGIVASHYPMLLDEEADGIVLLSHVGRPDERLHELGAHETLVIVSGPQGYISPGWYRTSPAVPTWDFAVAHLYGVAEILSDEDNLSVLERLVDRFEDALPVPFRMNGTLENAEYAARIVHGTVGFRMRVTRFEAKEKMSQDKSPGVVRNIVDALRAEGPYSNAALADRITRVNADRLEHGR